MREVKVGWDGFISGVLYASFTGCPKNALRLINNRTKAFCSIFKISSVLDGLDINLYFC